MIKEERKYRSHHHIQHEDDDYLMLTSSSHHSRLPVVSSGPGSSQQPQPPSFNNSKRQQTPAFLEKLFDILEDEQSYNQWIAWQPDGNSFLIKKVNEFSELVLPKYFKHSNIQSYIRQLNMYGFSKTRHDSNHHEFTHALFQRGRRDLLSLIRRKTQHSSSSSSTTAAVGAVTDISSTSNSMAVSIIGGNGDDNNHLKSLQIIGSSMKGKKGKQLHSSSSPATTMTNNAPASSAIRGSSTTTTTATLDTRDRPYRNDSSHNVSLLANVSSEASSNGMEDLDGGNSNNHILLHEYAIHSNNLLLPLFVHTSSSSSSSSAAVAPPVDMPAETLVIDRNTYTTGSPHHHHSNPSSETTTTTTTTQAMRKRIDYLEKQVTVLTEFSLELVQKHDQLCAALQHYISTTAASTSSAATTDSRQNNTLMTRSRSVSFGGESRGESRGILSLQEMLDGHRPSRPSKQRGRSLSSDAMIMVGNSSNASAVSNNNNNNNNERSNGNNSDLESASSSSSSSSSETRSDSNSARRSHLLLLEPPLKRMKSIEGESINVAVEREKIKEIEAFPVLYNDRRLPENSIHTGKSTQEPSETSPLPENNDVNYDNVHHKDGENNNDDNDNKDSRGQGRRNKEEEEEITTNFLAFQSRNFENQLQPFHVDNVVADPSNTASSSLAKSGGLLSPSSNSSSSFLFAKPWAGMKLEKKSYSVDLGGLEAIAAAAQLLADNKNTDKTLSHHHREKGMINQVPSTDSYDAASLLLLSRSSNGGLLTKSFSCGL